MAGPLAARTAEVSACRPLGHRRFGRNGTSVVELLVSTVCFSILMGMAYSFTRTAFRSARVQDGKADAQEGTLLAIDLLTRELRMAGYSAAGTPIAALRAAGPERVEVAADFNGDGNSNDANELVAYSYNAVKRQLMRATGGASPQPFVANVPPGGLHFSFFDANGAEITGIGETLAPEARQRVHRIDVVLRTEVPVDPAGGQSIVSTVSSSMCLRNQ